MNDCGVRCRERINNGVSGMPRATGMRKAHGLNLRLPRARCALAMTRPATPVCHCEEGVSPTRQSRNHRIRTNPFVCTVRRCAGGTPGRRALRIAYRNRSVGDAVPGVPCAGTTDCVQIRSSAPSAASRTDGACPIPTAVYRKISVGRGHAPAGELPTAHKFVRLHRLPLRGRMGHAPSLQSSIEKYL